ncbi:MAG TPA: adenine deaminase [Anaerolineaceae bacterium]
MESLDERKSLIRAALGQEPLDLRIDHVRVVNVYTGEIEPGALGIKFGRIVTADAAGLEAGEVFEGGGRYAVPGFIDSHVHIDSTLLTPAGLAELIVPCGTTTLLADPMEISNVAGLRGLETLVRLAEGVPYHLFLEVSSRVPTAPGLETTGGEMGLAEVQQVLAWPNAVSLGELDPSKVLGLGEEYLAKVQTAYGMGKIANGHAAGLGARDLAAYANGGLLDDHECVDYQDARARLRLGLSVMVREGSTERNLELILNGARAENMSTRHLMFCTDDKHPDDIIAEGHINYMVQKAVGLGYSPIEAVQMASLNTAIHFRLDHILGSLTPNRWADVLLVDDLQRMVPSDVFVQGRWAAHDGQLTGPVRRPDAPAWILDTVKVTRGRSAADFTFRAAGDRARVRVIKIFPDQIINQAETASLAVAGGNVVTDPARDVLKLAVVERYGKNGNIGMTFVKGFGLQRGALASSVSHDHHNIVVVGTNDEDMAACVRAVEAAHGGLAVAAGGEALGVLPLPIGGLMSDRPAEEVNRSLKEINRVARDLGCTLPAPFMTLSFISLPTVPELGLTDRGLVDVHRHALVEGVLEG